MKSDGWVVKKPNGKLMEETFRLTKADALAALFLEMPEAFQTKYWKKWESSLRAYRDLGYTAVQVKLVEVKE